MMTPTIVLPLSEQARPPRATTAPVANRSSLMRLLPLVVTALIFTLFLFVFIDAYTKNVLTMEATAYFVLSPIAASAVVSCAYLRVRTALMQVLTVAVIYTVIALLGIAFSQALTSLG